jgi:hypothetical protein
MLYYLDEFIVDRANKTINGMPVQEFSNLYYDGKEDYHYEDEGSFVEGLGDLVTRTEDGMFLYNGEEHDEALGVICSDDDLLIDYFEMLHADGGIQGY